MRTYKWPSLRGRATTALVVLTLFSLPTLAGGYGGSQALAASSAQAASKKDGAWLVTDKWQGLLPPGTERIVVADVDGDGLCEVLASQAGTLSAVRPHDGAFLGVFEFEQPITYLGAFDLDRDGRAEVGVGLAEAGRQVILKLDGGVWSVLDEKFLWASATSMQLIKTPGTTGVVSSNASGQLYLWHFDGRGLRSVAKSDVLAGAGLWLYPAGNEGVLAFKSGLNRVGLLSVPVMLDGTGQQPIRQQPAIIWSNYPWGKVTGVTASQRWLLAATDKRLLYAYSLSDKAGSLAWQEDIPFFDLSDLGWSHSGGSSFLVGRSADRFVAAPLENTATGSADAVGIWWQSEPIPGLKGVSMAADDRSADNGSADHGSVWAWTAAGDLWRFEFFDLNGWTARLLKEGREGASAVDGGGEAIPLPFSVFKGSVMLAARELAAATGMELRWVGQNKKEVWLSLGGHTLRAVPEAPAMEIDGKLTGGLTPLHIQDGRLYLPAGVLEMWLGWRLELDRERRIIYLGIQQ